MSTQDIVETFRQKQRTESVREVLLDLYADRFGAPPEDVTDLIDRMQDRAVLRGWLKVAATGSADEVHAALRAQAP